MLEDALGVNPFKVGLVGAGDAHTGLSTPDDDNFFGKFTAYEPSEHRSNHLAKLNKALGIDYCSWRYTTSGLTPVWAPTNTRGAIFDAMERREVYATTGPRIRVRFFGGWDFDASDRAAPRSGPGQVLQGRSHGRGPAPRDRRAIVPGVRAARSDGRQS
jgi:hypothetical protein